MGQMGSAIACQSCVESCALDRRLLDVYSCGLNEGCYYPSAQAARELAWSIAIVELVFLLSCCPQFFWREWRERQRVERVHRVLGADGASGCGEPCDSRHVSSFGSLSQHAQARQTGRESSVDRERVDKKARLSCTTLGTKSHGFTFYRLLVLLV